MFKASLSLASTTKNQTCPGASSVRLSEGYAGALHVFDDVGNEIHVRVARVLRGQFSAVCLATTMKSSESPPAMSCADQLR